MADYTLSIIMRATTEQINGVWQGACYPFREGISTGILNVHFTPDGKLLCGGTNRGWPVRGIKPFALERLEWTALEFLIAADIIYTIAVDQTFMSLGMLGLLVLIRTFLSFALELEVGGRWPCQDRGEAPADQ